jgi:hypothetical protein
MKTLPVAECYAAHRALITEARRLSRQLQRALPDESDLLRFGATCVDLAAQQALAARDDRQAVRGWAECDIGDRQIRIATYRALAHQVITTAEYDDTFATSIRAANARRDEMLRLRRRLRLDAVI